MLIEVINNGLVPYCGYNDNNSLSDILFSFMLEHILSAIYMD